jgi:hypothetical protein
MIDGLDGDDAWVMVEDEFLSTAKLFTQHLHHAEYQRLKKLVRAKNASTVTSILRATDGKTPVSLQTKKKIEGAAQRRQNERAIRNVNGDDSDSDVDVDSLDEEDPWMRDPRLAGLMNTKEPSTNLGKLTGVQSKAKTAAGYELTSRSISTVPEPDEDTDDDTLDLDAGPSSWRSANPTRVLPPTAVIEKRSRPRIASPVDEISDEDNLDTAPPGRTMPTAWKKPVAWMEPLSTGRQAQSTLAQNIVTEKSVDRPSIYEQQTRFPPVRDSSSTLPLGSLTDNDPFPMPKRSALLAKVTGRLAKRTGDKVTQENDKNRSSRPSLDGLDVPPTHLW